MRAISSDTLARKANKHKVPGLPFLCLPAYLPVNLSIYLPIYERNDSSKRWSERVVLELAS